MLKLTKHNLKIKSISRGEKGVLFFFLFDEQSFG